MPITFVSSLCAVWPLSAAVFYAYEEEVGGRASKDHRESVRQAEDDARASYVRFSTLLLPHRWKRSHIDAAVRQPPVPRVCRALFAINRSLYRRIGDLAIQQREIVQRSFVPRSRTIRIVRSGVVPGATVYVYYFGSVRSVLPAHGPVHRSCCAAKDTFDDDVSYASVSSG